MADTRDLLVRSCDIFESHFKIPGTAGFVLRKQIQDHLADLNWVTEQEIMENIKAILEGLTLDAVRIREGGPENLLMSLAVTVSRMQMELRRLRTEKATGG